MLLANLGANFSGSQQRCFSLTSSFSFSSYFLYAFGMKWTYIQIIMSAVHVTHDMNQYNVGRLHHITLSASCGTYGDGKGLTDVIQLLLCSTAFPTPFKSLKGFLHTHVRNVSIDMKLHLYVCIHIYYTYISNLCVFEDLIRSDFLVELDIFSLPISKSLDQQKIIYWLGYFSYRYIVKNA